MKSRAIDVIAMESASSSTLEGLDVQAIADRLNVNHVLTGSVSSSTDTFSVKLRLLNAVGEVVWKELVEDSVDQLFVVQAKIATALERQLGAEGDDVVPVSNVVRERCEMPADLVALENYYTARLYIELRAETTESQQQIREAVRLYEDLIASHPTFSEAYSGLAWALHRQSYYDPEFALPREEMGRRMQSLAESAVAECATNAEAMHLLPNEYDHANPWLGTWQQLSAFVRMEPSKGEHYQQLSAHYRFTGLNNRAVEVAQTNLAMNPLSPRAMWDLAGALQYDGQLQASSDLYEQAIELGHKGMNFARMSMAIQECGARVDCLADLNVLSPNELEQVEMVRLIQREPENDAQQRESIDAALALHLKSPSDFVNMLNHMACSFEHLTPLFFELWDQNKSLQQDQGFWFWPNQWLPACQSVWSDPRFPDFVAEFGFVEYWQEVGWPEACQPTADGFACGRNIQK
jgi:tetratricopeptide (TPR) repeat protein